MTIRKTATLTATLLASVFTLSQPALAQDGNADEPRSDNEIVVQGEIQVDRADARDQARDITPNARTSMDPLARFQKPICPGVWGLSPENAQALIDRMYYNAEQAGVPVNVEENCPANIWVIFVDDPAETFAEMRDEQAFLVRDLGYWERERVEEQDGAAMSWNITTIRNRGGTEMQMNSTAADLPGPVAENTIMSRTNAGIREDIEMSVVLFRRSRLAEADVLTVADYATMRALAKTEEPNEDLSFDSVFGAFGSAADVKRISVFDRAYLRALYRSSPTRLSRLALSEIDALMEEEYARMESEGEINR